MNIGVIFAGGTGSRMHSKEKPKQFLEIYNKPIIIHTLDIFENCKDIDAVVISCLSGWEDYLRRLLYKFRIDKVKKVVTGGATGQLSIYKGLCAAEEVADGEKAVVLIHDGVRPLISPDLLSRNIQCVKDNGNAITTGMVTETILVVDNDDVITEIPERKNSRVAKAPQSFWLEDVLHIQRKAIKEGMTEAIDTCTLMRTYGVQMHMVDGPYENIKITTPGDFYIMRAILEARENAQIYGYGEE